MAAVLALRFQLETGASFHHRMHDDPLRGGLVLIESETEHVAKSPSLLTSRLGNLEVSGNKKTRGGRPPPF